MIFEINNESAILKIKALKTIFQFKFCYKAVWLLMIFIVVALLSGCATTQQRSHHANLSLQSHQTNCQSETVLLTNLTLPAQQRVYLQQNGKKCVRKNPMKPTISTV